MCSAFQFKSCQYYLTLEPRSVLSLFFSFGKQSEFSRLSSHFAQWQFYPLALETLMSHFVYPDIIIPESPD